MAVFFFRYFLKPIFFGVSRYGTNFSLLAHRGLLGPATHNRNEHTSHGTITSTSYVLCIQTTTDE